MSMAMSAPDTFNGEKTRATVYRPMVDIYETDDELVVQADVPGTKTEDIEVRYENGTMTIHAKATERQGEGTNYVLREYGVGDFYRSFQVAESIDGSRISAELSHGVLTLRLPKSEQARPRKIEVRSA